MRQVFVSGFSMLSVHGVVADHTTCAASTVYAVSTLSTTSIACTAS